MEFLITTVLLLTAGSLMALCCTALIYLRRGEGTKSCPMPEPSEEERRALHLAAEAQKRYEQGFVNLMSYDGSPAARKEAELR